jgi:hypothetical protein
MIRFANTLYAPPSDEVVVTSSFELIPTEKREERRKNLMG